ncbi:MAG: DUF6056 family protein [Lachnospiraceae bacterium]|nr:DUF6056 family protein [Lachnospiraceae bacterium]
MKKIFKDDRYAWLFAIVSVVVIFITHHYVPFMMDDNWYSTVLSSDQPIRNFSDIVNAQIWHYNNWGGRSMTHSLLQCILLTGETAADVLNTLVTVLLAVIILLTGDSLNVKKSVSNLVLKITAVVALLVGMNANWKMSMFWESGAANYLYITCFILVFINTYLRALDVKKDLTLVSLWIIPLGIISGWSNENMGPVALLVSVATMIIVYKRHEKIKLWMILGSISSLAGSIACIVAPGNFVRSAQDNSHNVGIIWKLFLRGYSEMRGLVSYLFPALFITVVMYALLKLVAKEKVTLKEGILLICALLSWGAMVLSPHYPDRASFGTMTFLFCVCVSWCERIVKKNPEAKNPILIGLLFIWLRAMFFCCEFIAMSKGWII